MKIDQEKSDFLDEMLNHWQEENLLSEDTVEKLRSSYEAKSFDWRRLAQYSFWVAMACGVISLGALLIDNKILHYLESLFDASDLMISILSAVAAVIVYYLAFKRKKSKSNQVFSNEALVFSGVMLTANAIAYLGKSLDNGSSHFSLLILFSVFVYGILAFVFKSRLIWAFVLISLGAWFGTETGYLSRWNYYFAGMNYPLRFVFFGLIVTAVSFIFKNNKKLVIFYQTNYICGMIYLFVSLWLLSVFGNFGTLEEWYSIKQLSLFYWGILSASACIVSIFAGLKYRDDIAREFGITFLFINLYTRYFEYFWDSWHKALFFSVLAASFWLIGRKAEKIWNLEFLKN
ncbi:DUF2157 domain-containing protein [Pedobacter metabolipauper]|uniref:Putative membrane protein DUF2157 n=1 Tax=Pedobacter metabolipauper TaxID=425513 RepID=A0A4R6SWS2_9SPHI|nr:DUF2157 domain-containing protein [Pedobacter metabolipauper]TDQ08851.1 putative membrane protein DUF2157 [Pedobacter metabolipauper]